MRNPMRRLHALLFVCAGLAAMAPCRAGEGDAASDGAAAPPAAAAGWDWDWAALRDDMVQNASLALGLATTWASSYAGAASQGLRPRAVWAFQYGRIRLSTGGGAAILGIAQDPRGPGASAELVSGERLRAGIALRIDRGRNSSDIDGLEDLPNVPSTVRGRAYASYALTPQWTLAGAISPDLLDREGGTVGTLDLGYRAPLTPAAEWYVGAGINAADATYMNSYYGVSEATAATTGRAAYAPGAGVTGVRLGVGFTGALTSRWILFGAAGVSRLLGGAAASPLTEQPTSFSVSLGLAYRWGAKYEGLTSVLLPRPLPGATSAPPPPERSDAAPAGGD